MGRQTMQILVLWTAWGNLKTTCFLWACTCTAINFSSTSNVSIFCKNFLKILYDISLRIMGSQNWWFGDPRTLLYRVKPLHRRVQWFLGLYLNLIYFFVVFWIYSRSQALQNATNPTKLGAGNSNLLKTFAQKNLGEDDLHPFWRGHHMFQRGWWFNHQTRKSHTHPNQNKTDPMAHVIGFLRGGLWFT